MEGSHETRIANVRPASKERRNEPFYEAFPSSIIEKKVGGIPVRAQLEATSPGDELEKEADSMADVVMQKMATGTTGTPLSGSVRPRPSVNAYGGTSAVLPPQMESQLTSSLGGGQAMPSALQSKMEGAFGQSFSNVRLHTDTSASKMSSSIGAKAFTFGNDVFFKQGQFQPESSAGQHLLAHELTHVLQGSGMVARQTGDHNDFSDPSWYSSFVPGLSPLVLSNSQIQPIYHSLGYSSPEDIQTLFKIIDFLIDPKHNEWPGGDQRYLLSNPPDKETAMVFIYLWLRYKRFSELQSYAILGNWYHESRLDSTVVEGPSIDENSYGVWTSGTKDSKEDRSKWTLTELYRYYYDVEKIDGRDARLEEINQKAKVFKNVKGKRQKTPKGTYNTNGVDGVKGFLTKNHQDPAKRDIWQYQISQPDALAGGGIGQWTGNRAVRLGEFATDSEVMLGDKLKIEGSPSKYSLVVQLAFAFRENRFESMRPASTIWPNKGTELEAYLQAFMKKFEGVKIASDRRKAKANTIAEELKKKNLDLSKYGIEDKSHTTRITPEGDPSNVCVIMNVINEAE